MSDSSTKRESGFSLLEMVIAMALGTLVLGAAVQLYSQGVAATWTVSQRAEMQQDFRAASNMMTKDLSLAGAGLGNGAAIALPSLVTPVYGCAQMSGLPCYLGSANNAGLGYPKQGTTAYLYGLMPGLNNGPTLNASQGATDVITVVYADSSFYLNCYTATVTSSTVVTFTLPSPLTCVLPNGVAAPQNVNDTVIGLTPGDLILFSYSPNVVAEVTAVNSNVVTFAAGDALKMNQTTAASGNLAHASGSGTGTRIFAITYYIDNSVTPARLMRQVSGHAPMPVADNMAYLKFSYDLFNDATNTPEPNQTDGGAALSLLPNQITKINILHMAMDSTVKGAKGGYQGMDLETSVSARNLTYSNGYPQ